MRRHACEPSRRSLARPRARPCRTCIRRDDGGAGRGSGRLLPGQEHRPRRRRQCRRRLRHLRPRPVAPSEQPHPRKPEDHRQERPGRWKPDCDAFALSPGSKRRHNHRIDFPRRGDGADFWRRGKGEIRFAAVQLPRKRQHRRWRDVHRSPRRQGTEFQTGVHRNSSSSVPPAEVLPSATCRSGSTIS